MEFPRNLIRRLVRRIVLGLGVQLHKLETAIARETLPRFANNPRNVRIDLPRRIINPDRIFLGEHVWLGPGSFLNAITRYPGVSTQAPGVAAPVVEYNPTIRIGSRVTATGGLQIGAVQEVTIEDDVLLAANVIIADNAHGHADGSAPFKYQELTGIAPVRIGKGCWIGQNVVVLPGVVIGEQSIVGANSVVTRSIPSRCIAVGAPARVVKEWDERSRAWVAVPATSRIADVTPAARSEPDSGGGN